MLLVIGDLLPDLFFLKLPYVEFLVAIHEDFDSLRDRHALFQRLTSAHVLQLVFLDFVEILGVRFPTLLQGVFEVKILILSRCFEGHTLPSSCLVVSRDEVLLSAGSFLVILGSSHV